MSEWFVLVNPTAGGGRGRKMWPRLGKMLAEAGIEHEAVYSEKRSDSAQHIRRAVESGYRKIIIAGGDGTLHVALNGLVECARERLSEFTIGVIPVGTGNDWIRTFGIPSDCKGAIRCIAEGKTLRQDLAAVTVASNNGPITRVMANAAGLGLDARVIEAVDHAASKGKKGKGSYVLNLLRTLLRNRAAECRVTLYGDTPDAVQELSVKLFSATAGNGRFNGGGIEQLPESLSDDGLLDLTLIRDLNLWKIVPKLGKLFNGKIYEISEVEHYRCRKVEFTGIDSPVEIDGELEGRTPATVEIIPRAINVIVK